MSERAAIHRTDVYGDRRIKRKRIGIRKGIIGNVLLLLVVLAAVWILAERVSGKSPSLFGYRLLRVATGSMVPEYEVGDVILVRQTPVEELSVGDDITYLSTAEETAGMLITHRIISMEYDRSDGIWRLQTQGIAEGTVPDAVITMDQVYGKAIHVCRILTGIYRIFLTKPGLLIFILPLCMMMAAELKNLITIFSEGEAEDVDTEADTKKDEQT
jgi:signal peptidase